MLLVFIFSLMVFLIVSLTIVPALMETSQEVVDQAAGKWGMPSFFGAVSALLLMLVCVPGGPLEPVINQVKNFR
ncbi:hypothetical protein KC19_2G139000 [Ceratodon purpureus]|uniref:Uncharacterized protein n=1 Tax=Ceratodon purpureus TaxID=3225 RepID=A0A8T0IVB5_CERPU|nr:hypothetical protein KC19_2G139000 [Ceratodon purpureus]